MFRNLTRKKQQLPHEECIAILKAQKRGVLSVLGEGEYPYGMPMNHFYNDADGAIYFHCGKVGHRSDALRRCNKASFCVIDEGRKEGEWALRFRSVIAFGKIEVIDDLAQVCAISEALCHKFTHDEAYIRKEIEQSAAHTLLLKLIPEHICGKTVLES